MSFISNFEETATDLAIDNDFDYVICGHIHQPKIQEFKTSKGQTLYLNSGDWIENLSALEYHNESWRLYYWDESHRDQSESMTPEELEEDNDWSHILSAMTAYKRRLT